MRKLNGSMEHLAEAFAGVFQEQIDVVADMERRIINKVEGLEAKFEGLEKAVTTANKNMAAQFAVIGRTTPSSQATQRKKSGRRASR